MSLALAAVGAVVAALLETSVAPYLLIGGVKPDVVLICAIVYTVTVGAEGGFIWAFFGGLFLDMLMAPSRPVGGTVVALLVATGLAAAAARFLGRSRVATAVGATFALTFVYQAVFAGLLAATEGVFPLPDPLGTILPIALENAIVALPAAAVARWAWLRFGVHDRIEW